MKNTMIVILLSMVAVVTPFARIATVISLLMRLHSQEIKDFLSNALRVGAQPQCLMNSWKMSVMKPHIKSLDSLKLTRKWWEVIWKNSVPIPNVKILWLKLQHQKTLKLHATTAKRHSAFSASSPGIRIWHANNIRILNLKNGPSQSNPKSALNVVYQLRKTLDASIWHAYNVNMNGAGYVEDIGETLSITMVRKTLLLSIVRLTIMCLILARENLKCGYFCSQSLFSVLW